MAQATEERGNGLSNTKYCMPARREYNGHPEKTVWVPFLQTDTRYSRKRNGASGVKPVFFDHRAHYFCG